MPASRMEIGGVGVERYSVLEDKLLPDPGGTPVNKIQFSAVSI